MAFDTANFRELSEKMKSATSRLDSQADSLGAYEKWLDHIVLGGVDETVNVKGVDKPTMAKIAAGLMAANDTYIDLQTGLNHTAEAGFFWVVEEQDTNGYFTELVMYQVYAGEPVKKLVMPSFWLLQKIKEQFEDELKQLVTGDSDATVNIGGEDVPSVAKRVKDALVLNTSRYGTQVLVPGTTTIDLTTLDGDKEMTYHDGMVVILKPSNTEGLPIEGAAAVVPHNQISGKQGGTTITLNNVTWTDNVLAEVWFWDGAGSNPADIDVNGTKLIDWLNSLVKKDDLAASDGASYVGYGDETVEQALDKAERTYSSVSEMVSDESLAEAMTVQTIGYNNLFDGGSNLYRIVSELDPGESIDDGSIIALKNNSYAIGVFPSGVNVMQFGVVTGDAERSEAEANVLRINRASIFVEDNGRNSLDFPSKTICVADKSGSNGGETRAINLRDITFNLGNCTLKRKGPVTIMTVPLHSEDSSDEGSYSRGSTKRWKILGGTLDGNPNDSETNYAADMIYTQYTDQFYISGTVFKNSPGLHCLDINSDTNFYAENIKAIGQDRDLSKSFGGDNYHPEVFQINRMPGGAPVSGTIINPYAGPSDDYSAPWTLVGDHSTEAAAGLQTDGLTVIGGNSKGLGSDVFRPCAFRNFKVSNFVARESQSRAVSLEGGNMLANRGIDIQMEIEYAVDSSLTAWSRMVGTWPNVAYHNDVKLDIRVTNTNEVTGHMYELNGIYRLQLAGHTNFATRGLYGEFLHNVTIDGLIVEKSDVNNIELRGDTDTNDSVSGAHNSNVVIRNCSLGNPEYFNIDLASTAGFSIYGNNLYGAGSHGETKCSVNINTDCNAGSIHDNWGNSGNVPDYFAYIPSGSNIRVHNNQVAYNTEEVSIPGGGFQILYTNGSYQAGNSPDEGTWTAGTYLYNRFPGSGKPRGWVCTESGSPGTWIADSDLP